MGLPFLFLGLIGLWFGADLAVEGTKRLAKVMNISQTFVGLTVISIGTSLPEIFTNLIAGLQVARGIPASGIAIGTNLGSEITQITFILGLTAILGTIIVKKKILKRDGFMILLSAILVFIVGFTDFTINWEEGLFLILIYFFYLWHLTREEKLLKKIKKGIAYKGSLSVEQNSKAATQNLVNTLKVVLGLVVLWLASRLVVDNALQLAEVWGVAQSFVGVMIIGVGTGLPELSTAITGVFKKAKGISIGTLIGSNITDPLFSLGIGALAAGTVGLTFEKNLLWFDVPFWFTVSAIALFMASRHKLLHRKHGIVLVSLYLLFVFIKIKFFLHV